MKKERQNKKKEARAYIDISPVALSMVKSTAAVALSVLAGATVLTMMVALPGLAQVVGGAIAKHNRADMRRIYIREKYDPLGKPDEWYKKSQQTLYYLRRRGYIEFDNSMRDSVIKFTEKGKAYLRKLKLITEAPRKPKVWDKTWWVVLADIPTKTHRGAAEHLRRKLKAMDFYPLQRTVWIHPYNPTQAVNEITKYYDLGKFVTIIQAQRLDIEDLGKLKKHFRL